jgi:hypothetical protein
LSLRLARHVTRDLVRPLAARLAPELLAVAVVLAQFWTLIPWDQVFRAAAHPAAGAFGVGLVLVGALSWGPPLRAMFVERTSLAPVWRLAPLGAARGIAIGPALAIATLSAWLPALVWPNPLVTVAWRAALGVLLGALAAGGWRGAAVAIAVGAGATGIEVGARMVSLEAGLLPLAVLAVGAAGVAHARWTVGRTLDTPRVPRNTPGPIGPLTALVWRDHLAIVRTAPSVVWLAVGTALLLGALLTGLRVNGRLAADGLGLALAAAACVVAPLGGLALARLAAALGPALHVRRWPPGSRVRAATLLAVPLAVFLPTGVAMAAGAHTAGVSGVSAMWLAAACCGAGGVLLVPRARFDHARHLWWIFGVLLLTLLGGAAGRAAQAIATVLALWAASRRLERR